METVYVCGRCAYRSHHKGTCRNCHLKFEKMCEHCYCAQGNCVCLLHGAPEQKILKIKKDIKKLMNNKSLRGIRIPIKVIKSKNKKNKKLVKKKGKAKKGSKKRKK